MEVYITVYKLALGRKRLVGKIGVGLQDADKFHHAVPHSTKRKVSVRNRVFIRVCESETDLKLISAEGALDQSL